MAFNPGDRVVWAYPEREDQDPAMFHGEVVEIIFMYKVKFDDGTTEVVDTDDIEAENA